MLSFAPIRCNFVWDYHHRNIIFLEIMDFGSNHSGGGRWYSNAEVRGQESCVFSWVAVRIQCRTPTVRGSWRFRLVRQTYCNKVIGANVVPFMEEAVEIFVIGYSHGTKSLSVTITWRVDDSRRMKKLSRCFGNEGKQRMIMIITTIHNSNMKQDHAQNGAWYNSTRRSFPLDCHAESWKLVSNESAIKEHWIWLGFYWTDERTMSLL